MFGAVQVHTTLVALPRDYDALEQRGVRATATFEHCVSRGRSNNECVLRLDETGERWKYAGRLTPFADLPAGARVRLLIDPLDPSRRYTVRDVRERFNAGMSGLFFFGVGAVLVGVVVLPPVWRRVPGLRRASPYEDD